MDKKKLLAYFNSSFIQALCGQQISTDSKFKPAVILARNGEVPMA